MPKAVKKTRRIPLVDSLEIGRRDERIARKLARKYPVRPLEEKEYAREMSRACAEYAARERNAVRARKRERTVFYSARQNGPSAARPRLELHAASFFRGYDTKDVLSRAEVADIVCTVARAGLQGGLDSAWNALAPYVPRTRQKVLAELAVLCFGYRQHPRIKACVRELHLIPSERPTISLALALYRIHTAHR